MFSGALCNYAGGNPTRSYPFSFSLSVPSTWKKIAITVPGDTSGTWAMSGNGGGAYLRFDLGSGATYRATAGAWTNGNLVGATGAVNPVNNGTFNITGVKLEIGSIATPFNRQSLTKSMADCQRYYQIGNAGMNTFGQACVPLGATIPFPVLMRASPTVVFGTVSSGNTSGDISNNGGGANYIWPNINAAANGYAWYSVPWTASAEL